MLSRLKPAVILPWTLVALLAFPGAVHAAKLITGADIKDNSVASADVKNGSLKAADLAIAGLTLDRLSKPTVSELTDVSPWEKIPGGVTVTGSFFRQYTGGGAGSPHVESFQLPALPSIPLIGNGAADFGPHPAVTDANPACDGSFANPTAPPAMLCVYLYPAASGGSFNAVGSAGDTAFQNMGTFMVGWQDQGSATTSVAFTWAYTGTAVL